MSVKIYTTPTCGYCTMAKHYFKEKNISYTEYDVSRDIDKAEEMVRKSGQMGVPVIEINGNVIVGFNRPAIEKLVQN
ncbi:MAG: glutaredoxin family protein [Spirochaetaceae bacterium]|nr:MAG: glutaredoxin family protein [Spirochaetaceae bacterium]